MLLNYKQIKTETVKLNSTFAQFNYVSKKNHIIVEA